MVGTGADDLFAMFSAVVAARNSRSANAPPENATRNERESPTAAAAFEHKGVPGNFRHPLFGNRAYWYEQRAHPYLRPAAEMLAPKVADEVLDAVGAAIDKALAGELAT